MNKKEFFLEKLKKIEARSEKYLKPLNNKLFKMLNKLTIIREKSFLVPYLIFVKKILKKDLTRKIKLF